MDERAAERTLHERPNRPAHQATQLASGSALDDPRALTILTTEHWSLLSARSLVYNEAFTRVGMFLTFLSATLVALGLVSTATGFDRNFLLIAALTFAVDLFIGAVTLGRVIDVSSEDVRYLGGMNRLRHAYHDMVPGLERYFITGKYDDVVASLSPYGDGRLVTSMRPSIVHGFTTMPALLSVMCSLVAGVLVCVLLLLFTDSALISALGGLVALLVAMALSVRLMLRTVSRFAGSFPAEFPTPRA